MEAFYEGKFTNVELYDWMVGQLSSLYFQSYQLAYDFAKRAEKAYEYEVVDNKLKFIDYGYWDNLKKGLLAGEMLYQDLKRLEVTSLDQQKRGYEITKHISLATLNPQSLLILKKDGSCQFDIPEELFDMDYAGHFKRKIKSVSMSMPAVTGPYTSLNCKLTLTKNKIRIKNELSGGKYPEKSGGSDGRFRYDLAAVQSMVTSNGINDSGMFEFNLKDDKYLPFEGAGVISSWKIEMPKEFRSFDYNSISDVILHVKYTASEGGTELKEKALLNLKSVLKKENNGILFRVFSLKHDFPNEFHQLVTGTQNSMEIALKPEHYPNLVRDRVKELSPVSMSHVILTHEQEIIQPPVNFTVNSSRLQSGVGQLTINFSAEILANKENLKNTFLVFSYKTQ